MTRRRSRRWGAIAGVYRKAVDAFYTAGGATFLADFQLNGSVSGAAARGLLVGLVTGIRVGYVPNDAIRKPPRPLLTFGARPEQFATGGLIEPRGTDRTDGAPITIAASVAPLPAPPEQEVSPSPPTPPRPTSTTPGSETGPPSRPI